MGANHNTLGLEVMNPLPVGVDGIKNEKKPGKWAGNRGLARRVLYMEVEPRRLTCV